MSEYEFEIDGGQTSDARSKPVWPDYLVLVVTKKSAAEHLCNQIVHWLAQDDAGPFVFSAVGKLEQVEK